MKDGDQWQFLLKMFAGLFPSRVGRLSIKIPWKKLGWDPIIIILEDVFICACQRDDQEWSLDAIERRELAGKKAKLAAAELAKLSKRVCGEIFGLHCQTSVCGSKEVVLIFLEGKGLLGGWALTVQMEHIVTRTDTSLAKEGGVPWGSEFDSVWLLLGDVNAFNSSPLHTREADRVLQEGEWVYKQKSPLLDRWNPEVGCFRKGVQAKSAWGWMRRLQDGRIYSRLGFWSRQMGGRCLQFTGSHRAVLFLSPAVVGTPTLGLGVEPSKEEASNQLKGIWAVSGKKAEGSPLAHKEFSMGLVDLKGLRKSVDSVSSTKCDGFYFTLVDEALVAESSCFQGMMNPFFFSLGLRAASSASPLTSLPVGWLVLFIRMRG
ncbi:hypothetical protein CK203_108244 [Vitis vinifera]|uniref:Uncharacterized protein n=1 Tax=Vitis vinifera TaxID=29760 RepID=A0A438D072_VITVI|nr:hypothetical protein CK203_108244 [Vitis vinifera]